MSGLARFARSTDVGQVRGAEVVRTDADDLDAVLLELLLLRLDDRLAVDRVLVLDPDLHVFRLLAERLRDFTDRTYAHLGEVGAVRTGAHEVRQAAFGQLGGDCIGVPVELAVTQRRVARGVRHAPRCTCRPTRRPCRASPADRLRRCPAAGCRRRRARARSCGRARRPWRCAPPRRAGSRGRPRRRKARAGRCRD